MQILRQLEVVDEPDVLVVGAGCAGTTAAIAAARHGARTMVVERCGFAGGYITAVVGPALDGFVDLRSGLPVVGGLVLELARRAARTSARGDLARTRFRFNVEIGQMREVAQRAAIRFDVERFKLEADRLMRAAGVRVLYHTVVADVVRSGDRVTAVVLANKKGLTAVKPRTVVDASGDADVAAFAGAPFDLGPGPLQPMSLHFRAGPLNPTADLRQRCGEVLEEAHREGRLGLYAGPWMSEVEAGDLYFNATRVGGDPLDPDDLSKAEMQGREDARLMFELFKEKIPEFKDACFITSGPHGGGARVAPHPRRQDPEAGGHRAVSAAATTWYVWAPGGWTAIPGTAQATIPTPWCVPTTFPMELWCRGSWPMSGWRGAVMEPKRRRWLRAGSR